MRFLRELEASCQTACVTVIKILDNEEDAARERQKKRASFFSCKTINHASLVRYSVFIDIVNSRLFHCWYNRPPDSWCLSVLLQFLSVFLCVGLLCIDDSCISGFIYLFFTYLVKLSICHDGTGQSSTTYCSNLPSTEIHFFSIVLSTSSMFNLNIKYFILFRIKNSRLFKNCGKTLWYTKELTFSHLQCFDSSYESLVSCLSLSFLCFLHFYFSFASRDIFSSFIHTWRNVWDVCTVTVWVQWFHRLAYFLA